MIGTDIKVSFNLAEIILNPQNFQPRLNTLLQASSYITESFYVKEAPVDQGDFKGTIKSRRGNLEYIVTSEARDESGEPYPIYLFQGTGRLKGAPDFGYTSGRVRGNDVAYGIGGIRPNKVAKRAAEKAESPLYRYMVKGVRDITSKTVKG